MVSIFTILALSFSLIGCFVFPIVLCIVFMRKTRPGAIPLLVGMAVFIVFALILEQSMHYLILRLIPETRTLLEGNDWLFAVYGALAAGVFEEVGRLLAFLLILKKKREWKHGIAFGIGHGGIEAILLIFPAMLNNLIYAIMINTGTFDVMLKSVPGGETGETGKILLQVKESLLTDPSWLYSMAGFERIFTIIIQIAFSLLVLYAVYSKKYLFFGLAILLHAGIDFPAALYQRGMVPLWATEVFVGIVAIAAFVFILKSRSLFAKKEDVPAVGTTEAHPL